ncbi:MAG: PEP-CTERM sorting domain-containing protein [Gammaproteobacteria bacterium]|jgi:hypothetical protein|nr:PEP-CTERM sorting domain-containing protein [Gammaproteobacteria bacterium]MBT3723784.1 PEP-CTERM sorting domain-containing protein [Gammaproteobacteria bacterium]MBT4196422.1 PEP-CTERM sorting domain-containing protein [Gammaproteobacteria bacterium]MBT4448157.1 PEP-CTERM sorting domain-containing protein [Gammaproteobacteria bacterium]MBT4862448.1 PEP-CTERM sorting domain-containing protein [Gammaproteobacteria bacterium]
MFKKIILSTAFLAVSINSAFAITINNFSDWGIQSDFSAASGIDSIVEDYTGGSSGYLNPGYGGQSYDAEAMYATWDSSYLYVGVFTGRAQDAGGWTAGDIALDFGSDGTYEYGLVTSSAVGSNTDADGIGIAGEFYSVTTGDTGWNWGIWSEPGVDVPLNSQGTIDYNHPTSVRSGTLKGTDSNFLYSSMSGYSNSGVDDHYFISAAIDLSWINAADLGKDDLTIHWAANCNNDFIMLDTSTSVPEPSSLLLMSAGFLGLFGSLISRRKRKVS